MLGNEDNINEEDDNKSDDNLTLSEKKQQASFWEGYGIPSALIDGGLKVIFESS